MALQAPGSEILGENLIVYRFSSFAERGFCGICGTHIFHRPIDGPELAISVGLFPDEGKRIVREIFADRQPRYYSFEVHSERIGARRMALLWAPKLIWRRLKKLVAHPTP
jgi:hypothetical protein